MKIAIVGAGISGLVAASKLKDLGHSVSVFEQSDYVGGHVKTERVALSNDDFIDVDLGVFLYEPKLTHPAIHKEVKKFNLSLERFHMDVSISFGQDQAPLYHQACISSYLDPRFAKLERLKKEWSNFFNFSGPKNGLSRDPQYSQIQLYIDLLRFGGMCEWILRSKKFSGMSLEDFGKRYRFADAFWRGYLACVVTFWWGGTLEDAKNSDIQMLADSFRVGWQPTYIFKNGWRTFIDCYARNLEKQIFLKTQVLQVLRDKQDVKVKTSLGIETFDHVILSIPPRAALSLLEKPTVLERNTLKEFKETTTKVTVHSDSSILQRSCKTDWTLANYFVDLEKGLNTSTFWYGSLHPAKPPIFITWGDQEKFDKNKLIMTEKFRRTLPKAGIQCSSEQIRSIQGINSTWYCGAHVKASSSLNNKVLSVWHANAFMSGFEIAQQIQNASQNQG